MTLRNPLTAAHRFGALWANTTDNSNELLFSPDDIAEYILEASFVGHGVFNVLAPEYGAAGTGLVDDRHAFVAAQAACGSAGFVYAPPGTYLIASNLTMTSPVLFAKGAKIKTASGVTVTFSAPVQCQTLAQVFDTSAGGYIAASAAALREVTPQMFGAVANGTANDTQPMQAMFDCAFGPSTSPHGTLEGVNLKVYLPPGKYSVDRVSITQVYGFHIEGAGRQTCAVYNRVSGRAAWAMDYVSYGEFSGIEFAAAATCDALVELDATGTYPNSLKPQQLTFRSCSFNGNNIAARGYRFGLVGTSAAQGDTVLFDNCLGIACTEAAYEIIGFNALAHTFIGGNIQGCSYDGIRVNGGQAIVYGMSFQNQGDSNRQVRLGGADVHVYSGISPSRLHDVRSESPCLARGNAVVCNSEAYASGFFDWTASTAFQTGDIVHGTAGVSTASGHAYRAVIADLTGYADADNTGDTSHIDDVSQSWTVNQWAGDTLIMRYPNGFVEGKTIASNTATRITLSTPLSFDYIVGGVSYGEYKIGGSTGASEPNWAGASVTGYFTEGSGSMTTGSHTLIGENFGVGYVGQGVCVTGAGAGGADLLTTVSAYVDATHLTLTDAAGTTVSNADVRIEPLITDGLISWMFYEFDAIKGALEIRNAAVQFGRVNPTGTQLLVTSSRFSRKDWLNYRQLMGGTAGDYIRPFAEFGNSVGLGSVFSSDVNYSLLPSQYQSAQALRVWGWPLLWDGGDQNNAYNSVGVTRGDGANATPGSATDISRNVVAPIGTLGKIVKSGTDQTGDDQVIQGGLGTGAGGGGRVVFRTQAAGSSGTSVGNSSEVGYFTNAGRFVLTSDGVVAAFIGTTVQVPAASTWYFTFGSNGSSGAVAESSRQQVVPTPKTFRRMYVRTLTAQPADGSCVVTMRKNGSDTAVTFTIAANTAAGTFFDVTHSADFAAGDLVSVSVQNNSPTTASAQFSSGTFVES